MNRLILIRHGKTDLTNTVLCGRMSGVHLNRDGLAQASRLAYALAPQLQTSTVLSSPMVRAVETAEPLAQLLQVKVHIDQSFNEAEFGDWTGLTFAELDSRPEWRAFNAERGTTQAPNGESLFDVQKRTMNAVEQLMRNCSDPDVIVFTHADPIRAVVCFCMGVSLDQPYSPEPASVTVLKANGTQYRVEEFNRVTSTNMSGLVNSLIS